MNNNILNKDKTSLIIDKLKNNSKIIISIFILTIVTTIIFGFLNYKNNKNDIMISENFNRAKLLINNKEKQEEFKNILVDIIETNHKFYSPLSLYLIIENNIENDPKEIIRLFDKVLSNDKIIDEDKNLIRLKKSLFLTVHGTEEQILNTLNPIINSESIWKKQAINLIADYFFDKKELKKSEQYLKLLN